MRIKLTSGKIFILLFLMHVSVGVFANNGPILNDGYADKAILNNANHKPGGDFKGGKYSAYEAGTRVPTIIYWPSKIKPAKSQALLSQVDFFASFAKLIGVKFENAATAVDSSDMLDVLMGENKKGRTNMLEEAFTMSIREGNWKYIAPQTKATPDWLVNKDIKTGLQQTPQLYDLNKDPKEENNLAEKHPEKVKAMAFQLSQIMKGPIKK